MYFLQILGKSSKNFLNYVTFVCEAIVRLLQHTGTSAMFVSREEKQTWVWGESSGHPEVEQGLVRMTNLIW